MILLYVLALVVVSVYSYLLVPTGLYLSHNDSWKYFQRSMWSLAEGHGSLLALIYFLLILSFFILHMRFLKRSSKIPTMKLAIVTAGILFFTYPFLSQDIFNYYFYAKIFTYHHLNPFVHPPAEFRSDPFFHYVVLPQKTTFYGPSFVLLSAVPSFLSGGSFIVFYILYKLLTAVTYLSGVYLLEKWKKEWAVFFATSPLVLVEGLVNLHNDLIALVITLAGMYFVFHRQNLKGRILLLFSGWIKFLTLPFIIVSHNKKSIWNRLVVVCIMGILVYAAFLHGISTWYLMVLFAFIPYCYETLKKFQIFYFGSLIGYVYYIEHRDWFLAFFVQMMFGSLILNFIYNTTNEMVRRRFQKK